MTPSPPSLTEHPSLTDVEMKARKLLDSACMTFAKTSFFNTVQAGYTHDLGKAAIVAVIEALQLLPPEPNQMREALEEADAIRLDVILRATADEHADVLRPKQIDALYEAAEALKSTNQDSTGARDEGGKDASPIV